MEVLVMSVVGIDDKVGNGVSISPNAVPGPESAEGKSSVGVALGPGSVGPKCQYEVRTSIDQTGAIIPDSVCVLVTVFTSTTTLSVPVVSVATTTLKVMVSLGTRHMLEEVIRSREELMPRTYHCFRTTCGLFAYTGC